MSEQKKSFNRIVMNETEAAAVLECSVHKLRTERGRGTGCPYVKLGRRVVYRLEDITRHIDQHIVRTA